MISFEHLLQRWFYFCIIIDTEIKRYTLRLARKNINSYWPLAPPLLVSKVENMGYNDSGDTVGQRCRVRDTGLMRLCGWIHEQACAETGRKSFNKPPHYYPLLQTKCYHPCWMKWKMKKKICGKNACVKVLHELFVHRHLPTCMYFLVLCAWVCPCTLKSL